MNRWAAGILAVIVVISCVLVTAFVGALIGDLIAPARLDYSAESTPGGVLIGAFLGLIAGFAGGLWAAMRIVDEARKRRAHRGQPLTSDSRSMRPRS